MKEQAYFEVENQKLKRKQVKKYKWSESEVQRLRSTVNSHGCNWLEVAQHFPKRNANQCAQKWKRLKGDRSRRNNYWSKEEDQQLALLVSQHGQKWALICKYMKTRDNKQCRDRYMNFLNPSLRTDNFTTEEDQIIYQKYIELGPKWSLISKELENRSEYQVKNRFHTHIKLNYLQIQNPYQTKLSIEQVKQVLETVRENHQMELWKKMLENECIFTDQNPTDESIGEFYEFSNQNIQISNSFSASLEQQ